MSINKLKRILAVLSLVIAIVSVILILNVFLRVIPFIKLGGLPLLIPIYVSPLGVIIGILSLIKNKNMTGLLGVIMNLALVLCELIFIFFAPRILFH
ncbi:hypothetical protein [Clostridium felsineum]|uniref:Uncharacterized protein n=1 Tax=Clostridium felsineum TaxID=36839 RepID=A0A1S8M997_9CLOT|nr:hypothetical protein [Clostridium felsineum]MCR3760916.1 hypothetical protein [Clostridium felsineum]URZ04395.1 hypothetical protein CLAUR_044840 [Clostridium felsineum]URZ07392.1 hypothetical protein CLROS_027300 [Clostridium felsineum]URZ12423.1 hypothetical protein CROST_031450 [Clostridium felsineum]